MTLQKIRKRWHSGFTLVESRRAGMSRGFTLVELLVVIGIIVILIGILLPVAANVRKKGWVTSTNQEMSRIGSACQAYYNDFHAYPGPMPESSLDGDVTSPTTPTGVTGMSNLTSSQNLTLGLLGGLTLSANNQLPIIFPTPLPPPAQSQITAGPENLNPLNPKQFTAYMDVTPDELPTNNAGTYTSYLTVRGVSTTYVVPEFLDHIPIDPAPYHMPILYMRARVGAQGIVTVSGTTISQYAFGQVGMYPQSLNNTVLFTNANFATADTSNGTPGTNDFPIPSPNPGNYPDSPTIYLANPGFTGQPRGRDSFILISAGSDHIFGTTDDIIYSQ